MLERLTSNCNWTSIFRGLVFLLASSWMQAPCQNKDLEVHGFVSQGYLDSSEHDLWAPTEEGTFEFSEIGVNIGKRFNDNLRLGIQFFARDLGDVGNHELEINWALGEYRWREELGFRIGKIKQSIGIYNQERDVDFLRTNILLPQTVYPETTRVFMLAFEGFEIYGNLPGDIDYELYTGAVQLDEDHPSIQTLLFSQFRQTPFFNPKVTNDGLLGGALRWNTPIPGLFLASSIIDADFFVEVDLLDGSRVSIDSDGNRLETHSISYQRDPIVLTAEWTEIDVGFQSGNVTAPAGWYVQAEYQASDQLALHYHYGEFYTDKDDKNGEAFAAITGRPNYLAWQENHTLGARFDIATGWLVKAEWHQIRGLGLLSGYDPRSLDNLTADKWHVLALKATFYF